MEKLRRPKRIKSRSEPIKMIFNSDLQHPFLNGLILENIFGFLKGQTNVSTLAKFRVVCKLWDKEITKLTRKYTQINLLKILQPYPEGLDWTPSPKNAQTSYYYNVPYKHTRPFQNIVVNANSCLNFESVYVRKWFKIMGSQVKSLQFLSPFTCRCQNQFLERILKEWCPNLECLDLRGVESVDSLLFMSCFGQVGVNLICKNLKDLRISVDVTQERFSPCHDKFYTYDSTHLEEINNRELHMNIFNPQLVKFINELNSSNDTRFIDTFNETDEHVILPVIKLDDKLKIPEMSVNFLDHLGSTDGGIVGQIVKEIQVEKLSIHGMNKLKQCNSFVTHFHIRPNQLRSSLKYLELDKFLSKSLQQLHVIAQLNFPLTTVKLCGTHKSKDNEEMTRFLSQFSNTLEHLEISGFSYQGKIVNTPSKLILPFLPKLKRFVHEDIVKCSLSAENLWIKAPNLKYCYLTGNINWNANTFFESLTVVSSNVMRELKLAAKISGKKARMLLKSFPNLVKMDFEIESLGKKAYGFFKTLGKSKVENLKINFLGYASKDTNCKQAVLWKKGNIEGLKSLEIKNMSGLRIHLSAKSFSNGNLTSLKLHNFRIFNKAKKKLLRGLSHIPSVQLVDGVILRD